MVFVLILEMVLVFGNYDWCIYLEGLFLHVVCGLLLFGLMMVVYELLFLGMFGFMLVGYLYLVVVFGSCVGDWLCWFCFVCWLYVFVLLVFGGFMGVLIMNCVELVR